MEIKEGIEKGFLQEVELDEKLVKKELDESEYDKEKAAKAFEEEDFKWSIVKNYYAMFHAARAILFKLGLREKRHFVISVVLEDLSKKGKLEQNFVDYFNAAISFREDADYHYSYSKESALHILEIAEEFNDRMKKLVEAL